MNNLRGKASEISKLPEDQRREYARVLSKFIEAKQVNSEKSWFDEDDGFLMSISEVDKRFMRSALDSGDVSKWLDDYISSEVRRKEEPLPLYNTMGF